MKLHALNFAGRFGRSATLAAVVLGFSAAAANAAKNVAVPLGNLAFGNGNDIHAQSSGPVDAAAAYYFRLAGTCHGTGQLQSAVPPGTKLSALVNEVQSGAAATLTGVKQNPGGTLPFTVSDKTYDGDVTYDGGGFTVTGHFHFTLKMNIGANGDVTFDVTDVSITAFNQPVSGTIVLEPGTKLTVGIAPVISLAKSTQSVSEAAGTVSIVINRTVNLGTSSTVHVATVAGTADKTDFAPFSKNVIFDAGVASKTVKITIKQNTVKDGSRKFKVNLSKPVAALLGDVKSDAVTITDDD